MKYVVGINGESREISVDADGVRYEGEMLNVELADPEGSPVRVVKIGNEIYRAVVQKREGRGSYTIWVNGHRFDVEALDERTRAIREMSAAAEGPTGPAPVKAPMPGLIVSVNVQVGDEVEAGQGVVVMEAMKMENELRTTGAGRVKAIHAVPGAAVEKGSLLVELE
ncbi:MAG: biotin/lipoyl-binding protein [Gemmatimonadaceae bacterium]|nr:biotin/lipoyl-binding protein [Gemmatimonadaceae bacterium]